jgi:uncharacterized protein YyaL (SSP411 family)
VPLSSNAAAQGDMVEWRKYDFGMEKAENEDIPVIIDFYTDWCSYCKLMDENTYTDPDVIAKSKSFVAIKVEAEKESDVSKNYDIPGYPTIFFLMPDGTIISKVVGYTEVEPFLKEMNDALTYYNANKDVAANEDISGDLESEKTEEDTNIPASWIVVGFIAIFIVMIIGLSRLKEK